MFRIPAQCDQRVHSTTNLLCFFPFHFFSFSFKNSLDHRLYDPYNASYIIIFFKLTDVPAVLSFLLLFFLFFNVLFLLIVIVFPR